MQALHRQEGATLIVALVMLLILTIIGLSSVSNTTLDERMAGNMRDADLALQAAESGLVDAENYIEDTVLTLGEFTDDCSNGLCSARGYNDNFDRWSDPNICAGKDSVFEDGCSTYRSGSAITGTAKQPRYIIEHLIDLEDDDDLLNQSGGYGDETASDEVTIFRITVVGTGGSENARVMLQSTYGKKL